MRRHLGLLAAVWTTVATVAAGQGVLVAPHAVVIEHRSRSAAITLYNPGSEPAEVSISGFFGYPITDSLGEFELATPDPIASGIPSAAAWIEAYPRRILVGPLQRQTVRLLGRPPADLPDGEYWSRLLISARGGRIAVEQTDPASNINVGLDLEVRTIIPVQYRKGKVRTGVTIENLRAVRTADSLVARARLRREGNAAFVGTAILRLIDQADQIVSEAVIPLAVYISIDPRLALPLAGVAPGEYRLDVRLVAERSDLPPEQVLAAAPTSASIRITIP